MDQENNHNINSSKNYKQNEIKSDLESNSPIINSDAQNSDETSMTLIESLHNLNNLFLVEKVYFIIILKYI